MTTMENYDEYYYNSDIDHDRDESSGDSDNFNKIIDFYQNEIKRNTHKGQKLPKHVSDLIGHGNKQFLSQEFDQAIEICHEAIRIYPENSEPYHLLSIIYNEKGDPKRAVDFLFIATQLNSQSDKENWWKLADKYYSLQSYKNASYCYGRALKCEKTNVSLLRKKAECYDKLKDYRGAIKYYEKVINILPNENQIIKRLAKSYNKIDRPIKAVNLLLDYLIKYSSKKPDYDIVSILCDLLMSKDLYNELIYLIFALAKDLDKLPFLQESITNKSTSQSKDKNLGNNQTNDDFMGDLSVYLNDDDIDLIIEAEQNIDIQYNLVFGLIKINRAEFAIKIIDNIIKQDINEYYDIIMKIFECCEDISRFDYALKILDLLEECDEIQDKSVILCKKGIIHHKSDNEEKELEAYTQAYKLNPNNINVKQKLSEIYKRQGDHMKAKNILMKEKSYRKESYDHVEEAMSEVYLSDDDNNEIFVPSNNNKATMEFIQQNKPTQSLKLKKQESDGNWLPSINESLLKKRKPDYQTEKAFSSRKHFFTEDYRSDLIKKIKNYDDVNFKTQKRLRNLIELNSNFFSDVDKEIENILINYDMNNLILSLNKCLIISEDMDLNKSVQKHDFSKELNECRIFLISCLNLELERENLESTIYNILLKESKGKILQSFRNEKYKDELSFIYIFKKKKKINTNNFDKYVKKGKHKSKIATRLSKIVITKMKSIISSDYKETFIKISRKTIKTFHALGKYSEVAEICHLLLKNDNSFNQNQDDFRLDYLTYGFQSNYIEKSFEKAYIFFKIIGKAILSSANPEKSSLLTPFETLIDKKLANFSKESRNLLCFLPINLIFTKIPEKNSSQRLFFNKFRTQFKNDSVERFVDQISGNVYIQNGSYEQGRKCYEKIHKTHQSNLTTFILGFIALMETTNRNNMTKVESFKEAVDYFDMVKINRAESPSENYYNIGRLFTHLNMPNEAIQAFNMGLTEAESKLIDYQLKKNDVLTKIEDESKKMLIEQNSLQMLEKIKNKEKVYENALNLYVWNNSIGNHNACDELIDHYLTFEEQ